ncbi:DUF982 domain-containing protein [Rhizobiaceae bacterium CRRU44]|uniref:DUF982 domain-containing protein n=1 Tax=Ferranicluibacter rubi TaxID=2715133 RepID=A0AA44CD44_9HYPH|nr:DUF982 domain-containing protein [Ferranicluibacter rubi]NHT78935.1 DUF982 domain-containing protein [Ferranicluibacter rubi]
MRIEPVQIGWSDPLNTVDELAAYLTTKWPASAGEAYLTALMVCEAVLRGSEDDTAEDARAAFIAAAQEAGFSVLSDDDGPDF